MSHDHFQYGLLPQAEAGHLVVDNRIDGDRRLGEPIGQRLLLRRQRAETVRLQLQKAGRADTVHSCAGRLLAPGEAGEHADRGGQFHSDFHFTV